MSLCLRLKMVFGIVLVVFLHLRVHTHLGDPHSSAKA